MKIQEHKAYKYAKDVVDKKIIAGKYVRKACENFLRDIEDKNCKYFIDEKQLELITGFTKLINMATGLKTGVSSYEALSGFQWFFIVNALCWYHKDNPIKRRYEKSVLLIARKSGKSFLVALIFIILLLIEPEFSEFYSVAPDRELSSIVKKEVEQTIQASPALEKYFKILRSDIQCTLKKSKFVALANSENRMDGRKANVFVCDEVGALRNRYPIDAMQSSQMSMVNRTGILISTAYESLNNPMTQEVDYAKKVLDGIVEDDTLFALLFEPDNPKDWLSDEALLQANPLAIDLEANFEYLVKQRNTAIEMQEARKNFLTKHMNIFVSGDDSEVFISTDDLVKGRLEKDYDWRGRQVIVGIDLAQSCDLCGVTMVHYDEIKDEFYVKSWAFVPEDTMFNRSKVEKIDYYMMANNKYCFPCGDRVVSYSFIEEFILSLEEKYGVIIKSVGYDRYNCISTANRLADNGLETIEVRQHSTMLGPACKKIREMVYSNKFFYDKNRLFEIQFSNAKAMTDTNNNLYISKKKSSGKIDMIASLLNAICLWNLEIVEGNNIYDSEERDGFICL